MKDMDIHTDPKSIAWLFLSEYIWTTEENPPRDGIFHILRRWREDYYSWKEGRYIKTSNDTVRVNLTAYLQELTQDIFHYQSRVVRITKNLVNNVMINIEPCIHIKETCELNSFLSGKADGNYLCLENGLLNLDTRELIAHTPDYFTITKLPFNYDPDAKCPMFDAFIEQIMLNRKDYIDLIMEFIGYIFRPDLREQKFLLCYGDGANGKGVLFEVIQALVGHENCSQVPISRFGDRFALQGTIGKVCNVTNESSHLLEAEAENILKSYAAGDRMTVDRKHREAVEVKPTAKLLISTNALPRFNDKSQAIWRRILLVPFDYKVEEKSQIKNLAHELKTELPGILNRALQGLDRLNKNGFTQPQGQKDLIEEYRRDTDPARAFLLDSYEASLIGQSVRCSHVYGAYRQFCEDTGCLPMNERAFGRHLRKIFPKVNRQRIGDRSKREYVYQGLVSCVS
jgi:putative DNA primase/helicase